MPELFVLKTAWKLCTSEFLLFDDSKFKAARFHSFLIGLKGHVTCSHKSEQCAVFFRASGSKFASSVTRALRSDCFTGNLGLGNLKLSISVVYLKQVVSPGRLRECVTFRTEVSNNFKKVTGK